MSPCLTGNNTNPVVEKVLLVLVAIILDMPLIDIIRFCALNALPVTSKYPFSGAVVSDKNTHSVPFV